VFSWTTTWYPFDRVPERHDQIPYTVVVASIAAASGAKVLGMLDGSDHALAVGAPVRGRIDPPAFRSKGYPSIRCILVDL
jgi:hypothetical protein